MEGNNRSIVMRGRCKWLEGEDGRECMRRKRENESQNTGSPQLLARKKAVGGSLVLVYGDRSGTSVDAEQLNLELEGGIGWDNRREATRAVCLIKPKSRKLYVTKIQRT